MAIFDDIDDKDILRLANRISTLKTKRKKDSFKNNCSFYELIRDSDISINRLFSWLGIFKKVYSGVGGFMIGEVTFVDEKDSYCIVTVNNEYTNFQDTKVFISFMHPIDAMEKVISSKKIHIEGNESKFFSVGDYVKFKPRIGLTGLYAEKTDPPPKKDDTF